MEKIKDEVWNTIKFMNKCWTDGDCKELKNYFHKDMVALTPTENKRLENGDSCVKGWSEFCRNNEVTSWEVTDPKINIFGDTAIVTYYFNMTYETSWKSQRVDGRDMFTLVKEDGEWWIVLNQFSFYPEA